MKKRYLGKVCRETIERNTKVAIAITEKMKKCRNDICKSEEQIQFLESECEIVDSRVADMK